MARRILEQLFTAIIEIMSKKWPIIPVESYGNFSSDFLRANCSHKNNDKGVISFDYSCASLVVKSISRGKIQFGKTTFFLTILIKFVLKFLRKSNRTCH